MGFAFPDITEKQKTKFEELYRYYKNLIMCVSVNILHNQALAKEAAQDALIKILIYTHHSTITSQLTLLDFIRTFHVFQQL